MEAKKKGKTNTCSKNNNRMSLGDQREEILRRIITRDEGVYSNAKCVLKKAKRRSCISGKNDDQSVSGLVSVPEKCSGSRVYHSIINDKPSKKKKKKKKKKKQKTQKLTTLENFNEHADSKKSWICPSCKRENDPFSTACMDVRCLYAKTRKRANVQRYSDESW